MVIFFFASSAASAAYLTVSETFPLEFARSLSPFSMPWTGVGGIVGPLAVRRPDRHGSRNSVFAGYGLGALLMVIAAAIAAHWGIAAERKPLEQVAHPLSSAHL